MKKMLFAVFLLGILTACAPAQPTTDVQSTALAIVQTGIALTQTALPTFTPTATVVYPTPSPLPTQPPFMPAITPDAIQVERWREYQTELAKTVLSGYLGYDPDIYKYALCEWDILGRSGQELYVWAYCSVSDGRGGDRPAVVHLEADGAVQNVEVPSRGSTWEADIKRIFPNEVREKFDMYTRHPFFEERLREMSNHIKYRRQYPETPPMVIQSSTPTILPTP